ncbi:MAG: site-specific DNA-methyltransferase, partial [Planctomycetota bacterium]
RPSPKHLPVVDYVEPAEFDTDLHMAGDLAKTDKANLFVIFGEPDIGLYQAGSDTLIAEITRRTDRRAEIEARLPGIDAELKKLSKKPTGKEDAQAKAARTDAARELKLDREALAREADKHARFLEHAAEMPDGSYFIEVYGVDVFDPTSGEVRSDDADGIACWMIDDDYNEEAFFVRHAYFLGQGDPYKALRTSLKAEIDEQAWATLNSDLSRPFERPETGHIAVKVINHLGDEVMKVFRVE